MKLLLLTFCALIITPYCCYGIKRNNKRLPQNGLQSMDQWTKLEFRYPDRRIGRHRGAKINLAQSKAIPIDVQPYYNDQKRLKKFVTIPRIRDGIPFTLATIFGPYMMPYPNYEAHENKNGKNCDAIHSAYRMAINECNQMWVIDNGLFNNDVECPPQLLLFDLNTDQLVHRYRFPKNVYGEGASLFTTVIADVRDLRESCKHTMVYLADTKFPGLVVYDFMEDKSWRIEHLFMYPDIHYGIHTVAGERFVLMDGIYGMATDKENLYFHPLASVSEFSVPLRIIDNSTLVASNPDKIYTSFKPLGKRSSECAASAMDSSKNLYCITLDPIELLMWNVDTPYEKNNIRKLLIDRKDFQFVTGMKVVRSPKGNEELWMLSNRFQKVVAGTQNFDEINFRIMVRTLEDITPSITINEEPRYDVVLLG